MSHGFDGLFVILLLLVGFIVVPLYNEERLEKAVAEAVRREMDRYWAEDEE